MTQAAHPSTSAAEVADTSSLRFETHLDAGTFLIWARVNNTALAPYVGEPAKTQQLGVKLCQALGIEERDGFDRRVLHVLPLLADSPFSGQWLVGSPVGMESMQPPAAWNYDARLAMMQQDPERFPLMQGEIYLPSTTDDANDTSLTVEQVQQKVADAIASVLGSTAVVSIEAVPMKTALDAALDGLFGDFDGYG